MAHWDGSPAVRERLLAIAASTHSRVLFMEYLPQTLGSYLARTPGPEAWVKQSLLAGAEFMRAQGMVHFDAHFDNLLTDGRTVFFADLGLTMNRDFDLMPKENSFLEDHLDYDRRYVMSHWLNHHLPSQVRGGLDGPAFLQHWIDGGRPDVSPEVADLLDLHAQDAVLLNTLLHCLLRPSKQIPLVAEYSA